MPPDYYSIYYLKSQKYTPEKYLSKVYFYARCWEQEARASLDHINQVGVKGNHDLPG